MSTRNVADLTRETSPAHDRRASVAALGAALAGVLAAPLGADAKLTVGEKCKRRCRGSDGGD
jgi:hypothetical protein